MSRRDTILVAVLINAGLLVILFVSALKSGGSEATKVVTSSSKKNQKVISHEKKAEVKGDQVDQVIANYAKKNQKKQQKVAVAPIKPSPISKEAAPKKEVEKSIVNVAKNLTITVQKGDVLEKIARMHSVSVDGIMALNHLDSTTLQIGQILKLPNEKVSAPSKVSSVSSKKVEEEYYVVMAGDNPWTIAHNHDMQVDELLKLNNMSKDKAKRLRPGDRLRIK